MQRLSSWFEQLPLRRRGSRRSENCSSLSHPHKRQSKSAAPRLHHSVSAAQNHNHRDHSVDAPSQSLVINDQLHVIMPSSWNRQETVSQSCRDGSKLATSFLQSFSASTSSGRKNIRTNPWISHSRPLIQTIAYQEPKSANELIYASIDRTASFRIKNLDESIYSSGYGSQDSSPESSVHTPDWKPSIITGKRGRLEDKAVECNLIDVDEALELDLEDKSEMEDLKTIDDREQLHKDDEHVYHELEAFSGLSLPLDNQIYSSDSEIGGSSDGSLHSSRCLSPIYTQPNHDHYSPHYCHYQCERREEDRVTEYPNVASSFTYIPCANYRPPPEFHPPPPPPPPRTLPSLPPPRRTNNLEEAELDFLTELDAQIAELQLKSVEVRQLVEEARERRNARARNAQLYHELAELKRMKWVLHNYFELVL
ncbi:unnamed protein product [Cercopithifilaria johnstoni]|uniref:Uncharacterized protein n=1 Tax=Cercopithifilaria johnstoni TaxID=2874296 RepID=A0A8J2M416_9BILA|nr:unnamed protein product [Cercopithifilaria johnstoni]